MQIDISVSESAKKHISLLRHDQSDMTAVLIFGRFDFESENYYNLAFIDEVQVKSLGAYFLVDEFPVYIQESKMAEELSGRSLVIKKGELWFE